MTDAETFALLSAYSEELGKLGLKLTTSCGALMVEPANKVVEAPVIGACCHTTSEIAALLDGWRLCMAMRAGPVSLSTEPHESLNDQGTLNEIVDAVIRKAVDECGGNVTQAATKLNVSRKTIYNRLPNLRQEA